MRRTTPGARVWRREALVHFMSTGICGNDLRILHGAHRKYPQVTIRIPGHEVIKARLPLSATVEVFKTSEAGTTFKVILNPE